MISFEGSSFEISRLQKERGDLSIMLQIVDDEPFVTSTEQVSFYTLLL